MPEMRTGSAGEDGYARRDGSPRPRLLIVEDDVLARTVAREILRPHYEVDVAADGQEARGKLIGGRLDLMLCDIYMPGESGLELAEWVLAKNENEVAVVMVSGADGNDTVERALQVGAYGYLVKPYRHGDLLITVSNA